MFKWVIKFVKWNVFVWILPHCRCSFRYKSSIVNCFERDVFVWNEHILTSQNFHIDWNEATNVILFCVIYFSLRQTHAIIYLLRTISRTPFLNVLCVSYFIVDLIQNFQSSFVYPVSQFISMLFLLLFHLCISLFVWFLMHGNRMWIHSIVFKLKYVLLLFFCCCFPFIECYL